MIRRLLILAAIAFVWWWLRRLVRPSAPRDSARGSAPAPAGGTPTENTVMVRDRVCETFVAENRALTLDVDGTRHYFCSKGCRDKFLADRGPRERIGSAAP